MKKKQEFWTNVTPVAILKLSYFSQIPIEIFYHNDT